MFKLKREDDLWIVVDEYNGIVGSGETQEDAIEDARENIKNGYDYL